MKINRLIGVVFVLLCAMEISANTIDCIPTPAPPPPTNDECANAIALTVGTSCSYVQYTNTSATASSGIPAPGCASYSGGDVWFSVVVPASGRIIIDTQTGVVTDGGMALYSGACGSLTLIECDDDDSNNGNMPMIDRAGLTPGSTVYIRVWEYSNDNNGTFSICVKTVLPITNDECANAIPLTANASNICTSIGSGSVYNATASAQTNSCSGTDDDDVWFSFVAVNTNHIITLSNIAGSTTDMYFAAYSGTCGSLTNLVCSDANSNTLTGLTVGNTYYIRVYTYTSTTGQTSTFDICVSSPSESAMCSGADPFCTGTALVFPANVSDDDAEVGPDYGCLCSQPSPVWYYLRIANPGSLTINISSTCGDVDYAAWGPFATLTCSPSDLTTSGTFNYEDMGTSTDCEVDNFASPSGNMVDCAFSISDAETLIIPAAVTGQYYLVMITNYAECDGNINFNQTAGAGSTDCSIIAPPVTNNGPLCVGQTLQLTVTSPTAGATYSWDGPGGYTSTVMNPTIPSMTLANAGVYSLEITVGGVTSAPVTTTVVVNSGPNVTAGSNSPICAGSALNLTSTPIGAVSYTWSGPNSFSSTLQNPAITNATTLAAGTYVVTVTSTGGCTGTAQTVVIVNPMPAPSASNNGPMCDGSASLNLTCLPNGATGYSWSGPNSFTSSTQNPTIANPTSAASGTYTVTITSTGGCTGTAQTIVTINSLPSPTATSNSPICAGTTLTLTSTLGTSYLWSGPNSFSSTLQNPNITNATTLATGTYVVTVTVAGGCTGTAQTDVIVSPLPIPSASNNGPLCGGNTLNLTALPIGATSYNWSGPNSFTSAIQNPSVTIVTAVNAGTYTVTVTGTGGCTATAQTTLIINGSITVTPTSNSPICENETLNLSVPIAGATYAWSGPNSFTSAIQNPSIPNAATIATGIYSVTVTNASGCSGTSTINVAVNALPTPSIVGNLTICAGKSTTLTASGGNSYQWSNNTFNPSITVSPATQTTYTVTSTTAAGCTATTSQTVLVNANPNITNIATTNELCSTGNGQAIANVSQGLAPYQYAWSNSGPNDPTNSMLLAGQYAVTITDANGCTTTSAFAIQNIPGPQLNIISVFPDHCEQGIGSATVGVNNPGAYTYSWLTTPPQSGQTASGLTSGSYLAVVTDGLCSDTIAVLVNNVAGPTAEFEPTPPTASASNSSIRFMNQSVGGTTYQWTFGDGSTSTETSPLHVYLGTNTYAITLLVTDNYGCFDTISKTVVIYDDMNVFIPNAFSPNSDNNNEVFRPYGTGVNSTRPYEMKIFDRWGRLVFISNKFEKGWDGTVDGERVKMNTVFTYRIALYDYTNKLHVYVGSFSLLGSTRDGE